MKKEQIQELFRQFEAAASEVEGVEECWSARELQSIFDYAEWCNFLKVIDKAKDACKNSGNRIAEEVLSLNNCL